RIQMIVRGIYCPIFDAKKTKSTVKAISIVDEYLEHARVMIFENGGKPQTYVSSADWMVRNLVHRIEAAVPIKDPALQAELREIIHIQLRDNVKARILEGELANNYVPSDRQKKVRSQIEIFHFLNRKNQNRVATGRH
ncbi:MAG: polyphosphate kinase 1, partial [Sphingobacteriia bacterium]